MREIICRFRSEMRAIKICFCLCLAIAALALSGCGGGSSETVEDLDGRRGENLGGDGDPFQRDRLLEIDITLASADYRRLKTEGRSLASTARTCPTEFSYTEYPANVVIDGTRVSDILVRKKGYMGSLSPERPSFKLDFNDRVRGQRYQNLKGMTLNNNRQDASNLRQCLAYDLFRQQGLPAPRCNFARVRVNGELLGIFTHVEAVNDDFLENLAGVEGLPLYESQSADFSPNLVARFEAKHDDDADVAAELSDLTNALAIPGGGFLAALESEVDVEQFIRFWATETVLGFWDSASGNANNFYFYRDPDTGLLRFIPWGADTALVGFHLLKPGSGPLFRNFRLAQRLFEEPTTRTRYLSAVEDILDEYWDAADVLQTIDTLGALTGTADADLEALRVYVRGSGVPGDTDYLAPARDRLMNAIARNSFDEEVQLLADRSADCGTPPVQSRLQGRINVSNGLDTGQFQFTLPGAQPANASISLAATEVDSITRQVDVFTQPQVLGITAIGADVLDAFTPYVLQVFLEEPGFQPGTYALQGFANNLLLFAVDDSQPQGIRNIALGESGSITVLARNGSAESGSFQLEVDAVIEFIPGEDGR